MCNFFQRSDLNPRNIDKTVSISGPLSDSRLEEVLYIRIRFQTHYPAGYPTGKPDSDHLCRVPSRGGPNLGLNCCENKKIKAWPL